MVLAQMSEEDNSTFTTEPARQRRVEWLQKTFNEEVKALARGSKRSRMEGLRYLGLEAPRDLRFGIASLERLHATIP
jgi:hypothetical protein